MHALRRPGDDAFVRSRWHVTSQRRGTRRRAPLVGGGIVPSRVRRSRFREKRQVVRRELRLLRPHTTGARGTTRDVADGARLERQPYALSGLERSCDDECHRRVPAFRTRGGSRSPRPSRSCGICRGVPREAGGVWFDAFRRDRRAPDGPGRPRQQVRAPRGGVRGEGSSRVRAARRLRSAGLLQLGVGVCARRAGRLCAAPRDVRAGA